MKPSSLLFLFFFLGLFWACKGPSPSDQDSDSLYQSRDGQIIYRGDKANTVTAHILSDPATLHPINSELAIRYEILGLGFERLMSFDIEGGPLIPQLAEAPPTVSEDGLTYRYTLREEAAWPDGKSILAEDVIFSTKLIMCPHVENQNLKPYLEYIEDLQVDPSDPKTVIVRMKDFYINNDYFGIYSYVLDSRFYDPEGVLKGFSMQDMLDSKGAAQTDQALISWAENFNSRDFAREVDHLNSGSGPYQITEWIPEQRIVMSRNEGYWGKNGNEYWQAMGPDEIIFKIVRDENSIELQFKEQVLDVSTYLQPISYLNLKADPEVQMHYHAAVRPRTSFTSIALNNRPDGIKFQKFFDDPRVRRAMAFAIDRERMIEEVLDGMGSVCNSPVPKSNPHYNESLKPIPYDPQEAEALLTQAGWVDSNEDGIRDKMIDGKRVEFSFSFLHPAGSPTVDNMVQYIVSELARVGIDCQADPSAEYSRRVPNKEFDAAILSLRASTLPYDFKQTFHSENWPNGSNFFGYGNEEADRLMDELRTEKEAAARKRIADRIQVILQEDQPAVFLFYPVKKVVLHKRYSHGTIHEVSPFVQLNQLKVVRE